MTDRQGEGLLGFETIGNATVIVHDRVPVLATDPWIQGEPYFGSWGMSHEIPAEQLEHIKACPYLWFSHGHPDHLIQDSIDILASKTFLLPDHVGGRIAEHFREEGFNVQVLPTRKWVQLSPEVRVMCIPDYNQDATLLIAIRDHLIVNLNDGRSLGHTRFIRKLSKTFRKRWGLALRGYGDAGMMNIRTEAGLLIPPGPASRPSVGRQYNEMVDDYAVTHIIPFSCFHRYQREDSIWAQEYVTPLQAHYEGFTHPDAEVLPAFLRVDIAADNIEQLDPDPITSVVRPASDYHDNWSDSLTALDVQACTAYFKRKYHLEKHFGFITLRVGGEDHTIALNPRLKTGLTFEVPRHSLMAAIDWEVFDDLLIGNFMKVTLHGGVTGLDPDFTAWVGKYADNGRANSKEELREYFAAYGVHDPVEFLTTRFRQHTEDVWRRNFSRQHHVFKWSRRIYHALR